MKPSAIETMLRHLKGLLKCIKESGKTMLPANINLFDLEEWLRELEQRK